MIFVQPYRLETTTYLKQYTSLGISFKFFPFTTTYSIEINVNKNKQETKPRIQYLLSPLGIFYNILCLDNVGTLAGDISFKHDEDPANTQTNF